MERTRSGTVAVKVNRLRQAFVRHPELIEAIGRESATLRDLNSALEFAEAFLPMCLNCQHLARHMETNFGATVIDYARLVHSLSWDRLWCFVGLALVQAIILEPPVKLLLQLALLAIAHYGLFLEP
jgi:hypothetical protein